MPCTSATERLENAIPACSAPSIIASRAGRSPGVSQATGSAGHSTRSAASASASVNGLACRAT